MTGPLELLKPMSLLRQRHSQLRREHRDIAQLNRSLLLDPLSESIARIAGAVSPRDAVRPEVIRRTVRWLIEERDSSPRGDLLQAVHKKLGCSGSPPRSRTTNPWLICPDQAPFDTTMISRALQRFEIWVHSDGYREMHPLEQLTLSQLRLCEIQPFEEHPYLTAWTFSLSFLLRADQLLPTYGHLDPRAATDAICEGFRLSTSPLLRLHLEACHRSLEIVEQSLSP